MLCCLFLITMKALGLMLSLILTYPVAGLIQSDGECHTFVFLPFTSGLTDDSGSLTFDNRTNYGFSQMAATLLAVEHFNKRNATIVPELNSSEMASCNVQLKVDFFDTGIKTDGFASQQLQESGIIPCGIVGPFNDAPALELSVMARAFQVPIIVHRAFDLRVGSNEFTSLIFPDLLEGARNLVSYLRHIGRTNYIGVLYSLSDVNFQRREMLSYELDQNDMNHLSSAFINPRASGTFLEGERSPLEALRRIKERGYRTIVVAMHNPTGELRAIAHAAEELGMNDGSYFWVWYDAFDPFEFFGRRSENKIDKIVAGSAWIIPWDVRVIGDFEQVWSAQGKMEVDRLNAANPISSKNDPGYKFAEDDFFQAIDIEYGAGFVYDAVMALGLGACKAKKENGTVSGRNHLEGIRNLSFFGASGPVEFRNQFLYGEEERLGTRKNNTVLWAALNFLPDPPYAVIPDFILPSWFIGDENASGWVSDDVPFVYADGTTNPPPLSDDFEMNYIGTGLRAVGLTLMSVAMFGAVASSVFVFVSRKHRVLAASQPPFLYLICFGSFLTASAILTISFDEGAGWSEDQLSKACMTTPWLVSQGLIIIYGSLFTKMWRVHKLLQFRKRRVGIRRVVWPMLLLVFCSLVVMLLWTIIDPLKWVRSEVNELTHETIGECLSDHFAAFLVPLCVLVFIAGIVTGYLAWLTKDIDDAFSESRWIYIMIIIQVEVLVIGVPVIILLYDVSASARYMGGTFVYWIFSTSTLCLIMLPKYIAYHTAIRGLDQEKKPKRGERIGETRVTGFTPTPGEERNGDDQKTSAMGGESTARSDGPVGNEKDDNGAGGT